jgi:two-component system phosphate regulon sensor histidine kinase PhoR
VQVVATRLPDSQRTLVLLQDVTDLRRAEAARRDFVANVSHELRTPLTVLVGFLETVRELKLDADRSRDYLNLMAEQSRRMQHIIDDLLTLSSLESSPEPPRDDRVDVTRLLERIRGDLVSNAVRYTPAGGEVRLSWRASEKGAEFAVEDTGTGIEAEHIPRLTERFYRVDRGRSRESGGTGLGLAIVKHALARHQATLEIESTPGKGSRFAAKFPARRMTVQRSGSAQLDAAVLASEQQAQSKP